MTAANLTVDELRGPSDVVLTLTGELDIATAPQLRAAVERVQTDPATSGRVVLDLAGVTFCDSQGLSVLIALNHKASATGHHLVLANLGAFMVRLLDVTGLRTAFTIE